MTSEVWGYISTICFTTCIIPQALMAIKDGHSKGISWGYVSLVLVALTTGIVYAAPRDITPVLLSYITNLAGFAVVLKYKIKERGFKETPTASQIQLKKAVNEFEKVKHKFSKYKLIGKHLSCKSFGKEISGEVVMIIKAEDKLNKYQMLKFAKINPDHKSYKSVRGPAKVDRVILDRYNGDYWIAPLHIFSEVD